MHAQRLNHRVPPLVPLRQAQESAKVNVDGRQMQGVCALTRLAQISTKFAQPGLQ